MKRSRQDQRSGRRHLASSLIFAALSLVLIAIAGYLWYEQNNAGDIATAPLPNPVTVGRIEVINVLEAMTAQGMDAAFGRTAARATGLSNPGQDIAVGSENVYVFIYGSVAEREADTAELDQDAMRLSTAGTPLPGSDTPPHVLITGNIVVVSTATDEEFIDKLDAAIASLPDVGDNGGDTTDTTSTPEDS